ncbi:hypothetical protein GGX14DRAFT_385626 [Mycena pura]|uniref:Uncharacterized protein n=1 Tax=Mycena pura TaxID=153505 RepID=A0AAD6YR20_9AGAR|nr:hypothetical protein GGX14DRAFT_385626 [Mycena pura]
MWASATHGTKYKGVQPPCVRRPELPLQVPDEDTKDVIEAMLNTAYGNAATVNTKATVHTTARFLLESIYIKLSTPFQSSWNSRNEQIPSLQTSQALLLPQIKISTDNPTKIDPSTPLSYLKFAHLKVNKQDISALPEFTYHKTAIMTTDVVLLGDELVTLELTTYEVHSQSIPLHELLTLPEDKHGTRDDDSPLLWKEIRNFFQSDNYPCAANQIWTSLNSSNARDDTCYTMEGYGSAPR